MKKVTITPKEIDWSKPQWVQHKEIEDVIILTSGCFANGKFEGVALPCGLYPEGHFSCSFNKAMFKPLTEEITFTISNQD